MKYKGKVRRKIRKGRIRRKSKRVYMVYRRKRKGEYMKDMLERRGKENI